MAEGFILSNSNHQLESAEETGSQYFDNLLVRSFFQALDVDQKERYLMHDFIHDLARHVSRPYFCQVEDANDISDPFHFPHTSLLCKEVEQPLMNILQNKSKRRLHTLLLPNEYLKDLKLQTLNNMFNTMTYIRVLDDMFWHKITRLPPRMGKLTCLRNLHVFHTSLDQEGYGIEELKDMVHLTGTLCITKLENAANNAREAKLNQNESLDKLVLELSNINRSTDVEAAEETMLEDLQPHSNLKQLQICNYRGTILPVWMKNGLLQNLVTVSLKHCTNCRVFLLDRLPHLQQLYIKGMQELEEEEDEEEEEEEVEVLVVVGVVGLPSLDTLKISNCPKLRKLHSFFPNLRVLSIKRSTP